MDIDKGAVVSTRFFFVFLAPSIPDERGNFTSCAHVGHAASAAPSHVVAARGTHFAGVFLPFDGPGRVGMHRRGAIFVRDGTVF